MFDIGFIELLLVAAIGLIVIGPEKLPHTIRMVRAWITRFRSTLSDLQVELEKELDAEDLKKRLDQAARESGFSETEQKIESELHFLHDAIQVDKTTPDEDPTAILKTNSDEPG